MKAIVLRLVCAFLAVILIHSQATAQLEVTADEITRVGLQSRDPDPQVRIEALKKLGQLGRNEGGVYCAKALQDAETTVRKAAVEALAHMYYPEATPALLEMLKDADPVLRAEIALAIGISRNWQAFDPLLNLLKDPEPSVRAAAATGSGRLGAVKTLDPLIALLADATPAVRSAAARALGDADVWNMYDTDRKPVARISYPGPETLKQKINIALAPLLQDGDAGVRASTAVALTRFADARALPGLREALQHPSAEIRTEAAKSISYPLFQETLREHPEFVDDLLTAFAHEKDPEVRLALIGAFGSFRDPKAVDPLIAILNEPDPEMRTAVIRALGLIGDPRAGRAIFPFLDDANDHVRGQTVMALGGCKATFAVERLIQLLADPKVESLAAMALGQLQDRRAVKPLADMLTNGHGSWIIVQALENIGDPSCIDSLLAYKPTDSGTRSNLLHTLSRFNDPRVMPALIEALHDPNEQIQGSARGCLNSLMMSATTDQCIALIAENDPGLYKAAIKRLGDTFSQDPRLVKIFIAALKNADAEVRRSAVRGLSRQNDPQASAALTDVIAHDADPEVRKEAVQCALASSERNPELFLTLIKSPDAAVRQAAVSCAPRYAVDRRITEALLLALKDGDIGVRRNAALSLAARQEPAAIDPLLEMLADPDAKSLRDSAAEALRRFATERALPALIKILQTNADDGMRVYAIRALQGRRAPAVTEALVAALHDPKPNIQQEAALALGEVADPRTLDILLALFSDEKSRYSQRAARELAGYHDPRVNAVAVKMIKDTVTEVDVKEIVDAELGRSIRFQYPPAQRAARLFISMGSPAVDSLTALLGDTNPLVRAMGAAIFAQSLDRRALPFLHDILKDDNVLVRRCAVRALRMQGDVQSLQPLIGLLHDADTTVQAEAIVGLGRIQDTRATAALLPLLQSRNADLQYLTTMALAKIADPQAVEALINTMQKATDVEVRAQAINALEQIHDLSAVAPLLAMLNDANPIIQATAARALGALGDARAVDPLIALANQPPPGKPPTPVPPRSTIPLQNETDLRALGKVLDIVQYNTARFFTPNQSALLALGAINDPRATEALLDMVEKQPGKSRTAVLPLTQCSDPRAGRIIGNYVVATPFDERDGYSSVFASCKAVDGLMTSILISLDDPDPALRLKLVGFIQRVMDPQVINLFGFIQQIPGGKVPQAAAPLKRLLRDPDSALRLQAARLLSRMRGPGIGEAFVPLLTDESADIRSLAATTLRDWNDDATSIAKIIPLTMHAQPEIRQAAVTALGKLPDAHAVETLTTALKDADPGVRWRAAEALGRLRSAGVADHILALLQDDTALNGVEASSQRSRLLQALAMSGDEKVGDYLLQRLVNDPENESSYLRALATYSHPRAATEIARILAEPGSTTALHMLNELYAIQRVSRAIAMQPMPDISKTLQDERIVTALIALLQEPVLNTSSYDTRSWPEYGEAPCMKAAVLLGYSGDRRAVEPLIASLQNGPIAFRYSVVEALGQLGNAHAIPALITTLDQFPAPLRAAVTKALKAISGQDFGEDVEKWREWWGGQRGE